MRWKNLSIGKQIATGFGTVIVFLFLLGILSFTGVAGIVKNASEVIYGNILDAEFAQKEVDHLNWAADLNELITDVSVTNLTVQTDHTQCGLGKWLHGEGRNTAEAMIPSLAPLLKEMEIPHENLHASAKHIEAVYSAADPKLPGHICTMLNQHLEWASTIQQGILENHKAIDVGTNHTMCTFGKWLYSDIALKTGASDTILGEILEQIKAPHERLHTSAQRIKTTYRQVHEGLQENLLMKLDDHRKWMAKVADGIISMSQIEAEMNPEKCALGTWLARNQTKALLAEDTTLHDLFAKIQAPHAALHKSVTKINRAIVFNDMVTAKQIFNTEAEDNLKKLSDILNEAIQYESSLEDSRLNAIEIFKDVTMPDLILTKELLSKLQVRAQELLEGQFKASAIYAHETTPNIKKVQALLGTMRQTVKENILTDQAMLNAASTTRYNVMVTGIVAVIMGIFLAFFISRRIIRLLKRISLGMGEGAEQVTSAAGQVSSSSQSLAEGASEQAASIEETSSSMEEMSSMTKRNAENANHADRLTREAGLVVGQAKESMEELIQSMDEISTASEETFRIIKTIDEIAFQTNLLALNAAVEAARAGEAGTGFAVVANEVRNLAMRAADAAKNTSELIEGTVKKVNAGSTLVSTTNEAFMKVADSTGKVANLVSEISQASQEQSNGINQVNIAITEMDKVVQQNAANAEESASASEEMSAQAEQLKEYVDELVMVVTGKRNKSFGISRPTHSPTQMKRLRPVPRKKDSQLSFGTKEIKPSEVIPFDEDTDFRDF